MIINTSQMFKKISLYLYRETYGKPFGPKFHDAVKVEIESCGLETVEVVKRDAEFLTHRVEQFESINPISMV